MMYAATYIPLGRRNTFLTPLECEQIGNSVNWLITRELRYIDPDGNLIVVPAGFITDFASIPPLARFGALAALFFQFCSRYLWWMVFPEMFALWVCFVAEWIENSGTDEIAAVHDLIYATRCRGYWKANWILFKGMTAPGTSKPAPNTVKWWQWIFVRAVPRNWLWKRLLIYANVTLFGWIPWIEDALKRKKTADSGGR